MHCCHLGVLKYILASILLQLVQELAPKLRVSRDQSLTYLWSLLQEAFGNDRRSAPTNLTLSMIEKANSCPHLSTKAAESKALLKALLKVCQDDRCWTGTDFCAHRFAALHHLDTVEELLETVGLVPRTDEYDALKNHTDQFLLHYNFLAQAARAEGTNFYHATLKCHMMWHLIDLSKWLNPRATWCYEFESYIGHCVESARGCYSGTPTVKVGSKVVENAMIALQLLLHTSGQLHHAR